MITAKIAWTAGALAASILSGVGLGGYTVGGFNPRPPIDVIAEAAAGQRQVAFTEEPVVQAPTEHVCTGCDAKLYRDTGWYPTQPGYQPEDEWAREDAATWDVERSSVADQAHDDGDSVPVARDVALRESDADEPMPDQHVGG